MTRLPEITETVTSAAVGAALVELLTTGQHHHAGTPVTLAAVGRARRGLAEYGIADPAASFASPDRRLAALTAAGAIGSALATVGPGRPPCTNRLHTALTELAAVALGWLDTLPAPGRSHHDEDPGSGDEQPF